MTASINYDGRLKTTTSIKVLIEAASLWCPPLLTINRGGRLILPVSVNESL